MADGITITWVGAEGVASFLQQVTDEKFKQIAEAIADAGQATYDGSQADVPVLSGDLKGSGEITVIDDYTVEVSYGDGSSTEKTYSYPETDVTGYSGFVEFGTSKMAAQPYLGPNFSQQSENLTERLQEIAES